jgi:hypothetical protein
MEASALVGSGCVVVVVREREPIGRSIFARSRLVLTTSITHTLTSPAARRAGGRWKERMPAPGHRQQQQRHEREWPHDRRLWL